MARVESSPSRAYSKSRIPHSSHSSPDRLIGSHQSAANSYLNSAYNYNRDDDLMVDPMMDERHNRSTSLLHNSQRSRSAGRLAGASSSILSGNPNRYNSSSAANFENERDYLQMRNDRNIGGNLHYDPSSHHSQGHMLNSSHREHRSNPGMFYDDDLYNPPSTRQHYRSGSAPIQHDSTFSSELQHQNTELQRELAILKKELELTSQKLGSSMHSIKTFWSPELKKERALRKEEGAKYSLINDQLKLLNSENQKQAILVRQLEDELRMRMRTPSIEVQQQMEVMYQENEHLTREISILRDTIKELEIRIETQKQTLQSRDETVMKLLEALQNKGMGKEEERQMFQQMQQMAQKQLEEFRIEIQRRDQEILAMGAKMKTLEEQNQDYQRHIAVLKESLCAKEEHYNMLQTDMDDLRQRLDDKNRQIDKKSTLSTQIQQELASLKEHLEIKDRKINVLQRKIENMEELLKEKENQVDMARARLMAMQSHKCTSDGTVTTLEETIGDKDRQITQLREQKDRLEHEKMILRDNYEKEFLEYKEKADHANTELRKIQIEKDSQVHDLKNVTNQIDKLTNQISQLQKEKDYYANDLEKAQMNVNQLQKDRDRYSNELDSLKKKFDSQSSQSMKFQRERTELETELEMLKERFEKLNHAHQKLITDKDALSTEMTMVREKLDKANYNVQKIIEEKESITREYEKLLDKYDRCQTEKHRLDMELEKKIQLNASRFREEEEFDKMKEKLEMAISARDSAELEAGRLAKELEKSQIQLSRVVEQSDSTRIEIEQMAKELSRTASDKNRADLAEKAAIDLQKKLQIVEKQLHSQQNQYQSLHQQFQQYQRSTTGNSDEIGKLRNDLKTATLEKQRLQEQLEQLLHEMEQLQRNGNQQQQASNDELVQLKRQLDQQRKQLDEQQRRLQSRFKEVENREQSIQEYENSIQDNERSFQERDRMVREQTQKLKLREEQLEKAEAKLKSDMAMMAAAAASNKSQNINNGEMDRLRGELAKSQEENKRINAETERLLKLMQLSQEEQNAKEKMIANLQQNVKNLQMKLSSQPTQSAPSTGIDATATNAKVPQYLTMEEQQLYLESVLNVVKVQAFQMKVCLDKSKLMDALKHASAMISELRTTLLSPKNYYELYMKVTDELQHLHLYLVDELRTGSKDNNLYELVQYAGNIVPRLYLLVTVGLAYIKTNVSSRRDILKDLVEMCSGVQHPLKGLFLRSYLLQGSRNILADTLDDENESDGNVKDSIEFILMNFGEMNKLWVRMQHQGHTREKERLENERKELRILVGTNLVRLSQLESVTLDYYSKNILPGILEQIVSCRDAIAQEYLMECIIQVFPDEFHLQTLNVFLKTCAELKSGVNIKNIIISLMNRLASFNQRNMNVSSNKSESIENSVVDETDEVPLFEIFSDEIAYIVKSREMSSDEIISLKVALINLAQKSYPDRIDYIDKVMSATINVLDQLNIEELEYNKPISKELTKLMKLPIDHYNNLLKILELQHFNKLLKYFDFVGQKNLALHLITSALDHQTVIPTHEQVETVLEMLSSIINTKIDKELDNDDDLEELIDEQSMLARFLHQLKSENLDEQFLILNTAKKSLIVNNSDCIRYTLPPLVFQAYQLASLYKERENEDDQWNEKCQKIFQFCHSMIVNLMKSDLAELPLRLFLQGALAISKIKFDEHETVAYEFISQAFSIYEDEISESKAQLAAISLIVGTLEQLDCFSEENAEPLRTQCALAGSKLLKKPDQCRAAILCSHLFWSGKNFDTEIRDAKRVTERLNKSFNIAKQCLNNLVQVQLFIEILNHYIYFYERGCEMISIDTINELISKIKSAMLSLDSSEETEQIVKHFGNTINHLKSRYDMLEDGGVLYKDLVL